MNIKTLLFSRLIPTPFVLIAIGLSMASCENCKECYLIENSKVAPSETYIGERCDAQIKELESQDLVCLHPDCYYECR
jgi:hypothetical protein